MDDGLPPHRQLIWYLETALDALDEAGELDGFLPHWAQTTLGTLGEDLETLLERVGRETPALGPLSDAEAERN
jgi:hypothetical protein